MKSWVKQAGWVGLFLGIFPVCGPWRRETALQHFSMAFTLPSRSLFVSSIPCPFRSKGRSMSQKCLREFACGHDQRPAEEDLDPEEISVALGGLQTTLRQIHSAAIRSDLLDAYDRIASLGVVERDCP